MLKDITQELGLDLSEVAQPRVEVEDECFWPHHPQGKFTTASAMVAIRGQYERKDWCGFLWNAKVRPRNQMLAWKIFQGAVNTDEKLQQRKIQLASRCSLCLVGAETRDHLLFDCKHSNYVWEHILSWFGKSSHLGRLEQMINMRDNFSPLVSELWSACVITAMVLIWKRRCKWLYEQKVITDKQIEIACLQAMKWAYNKSKKTMRNNAEELMIMRRIRLCPRIRKPDKIIECYWALPPANWVKVNVDGASNGSPGPSGWGAVIRNDKGTVLATGLGGIGVATSFVAESIEVIKGIQQAMEMGMINIWVESDCEAAIQSYQADAVHWIVKQQWEDIKAANLNFMLTVNKREANFAADCCSKMGALIDKGQTQWWIGLPPFKMPLENHEVTYYRVVKD